MFKKGDKRPEGAGCKKGEKHASALKDLNEALRKAQAEHDGLSLVQSICDRAYNDGPLAIAILRKVLPDLKQVEVTKDYEGGFAHLTPAEIAAEMDGLTVGAPEVLSD